MALTPWAQAAQASRKPVEVGGRNQVDSAPAAAPEILEDRFTSCQILLLAHSPPHVPCPAVPGLVAEERT